MRTDKDLTEFLQNEVSIPFDEDGLWYKVFAVEDFSETESVVMFKSHHALADGMSLIGLITSIQDTYSVDQLREFRPE